MLGAIGGVAVTAAVMWTIGGDRERVSAASAQDNPRSREAAADRRPIAPIAISPDVVTPMRSANDDARRAQQLEDELEIAKLVANQPEYVTAEWPVAIPEAYREPTFRSTVQRSIDDCATGGRLAALSCDEPPCIAIIALGTASDGAEGVASWPGQFHHCETWRRSYGNGNQKRELGSLDCRDGRHEQVEVVSLYLQAWSGWEQLDVSTRNHIEARRTERIRELVEHATCSPLLGR
jgi:hypothetical protein